MNNSKNYNKFIEKVDLFSASINNSFFKDKEISIFGGGSFGVKAYKKLLEKGASVINFYDNGKSKHNTKILGIEVLDSITINNSNSTLVIASLFASEIAEKLAISVYHKFKDLRELYSLLKSMNPNYKFYLGHHTKLWYETVLYAIDKES